MKEKIQSLQLLRAIAASLVVLFHQNLLTIKYFKTQVYNFGWGWTGVDIFFVLSGFIITYHHFDEIGKKEMFKPFIKKRFIRVFPIYWFAAIISLLLYAFIMHNNIRSLFFLNFRTTETWLFIFKNLTLYPLDFYIVAVAWTLVYEIIFYSLFAVFIYLGKIYFKIILITWLTLILLNEVHFIDVRGAASFPLKTIVLEFIMGGFLAYLFKYHSHLFKPLYSLLYAIFLGITIYLYFSVFSQAFLRETIFSVFLLGSIATFIVFLAITFRNKFKTPPLILLVGEASYSIYLIHIIFLSFFYSILSTLSIKYFVSLHLHLLFICVFIITVFLGIIIHLLIEKPLIRVFYKLLHTSEKGS